MFPRLTEQESTCFVTHPGPGSMAVTPSQAYTGSHLHSYLPEVADTQMPSLGYVW